jgi:DNA-binding CsgD family transcriptional regulator
MKKPSESPFGDFKKLMHKLANNVSDRDLKLELEIHKKLLSIFQVGDYYYYVLVDNVFEASPIIISDRERQILQLLITGMTSKTIARYFSLSEDTIKQHRKNMIRKTGCKSTADLVGQAVKKGWV